MLRRERESEVCAVGLADERRSCDVERVEHRDHVGEVILQPVLIRTTWRVTSTMSAVVEQDVPVVGQGVQISRRPPHAGVTTGAGVEEHRWSGAEVVINQPHPVAHDES